VPTRKVATGSFDGVVGVDEQPESDTSPKVNSPTIPESERDDMQALSIAARGRSLTGRRTARARRSPLELRLGSGGRAGNVFVAAAVALAVATSAVSPSEAATSPGESRGSDAADRAAQAPPPAVRVAPPAPPDVSAPPEDAVRSDSGLAWRVLEPGTGHGHPGPTDLVTMHYTGWTTEGRVFDSTTLRGRPSSLLMDRLMAGMREGLLQMVVGERRRLWVPEALAFAGQAGRPAGMVVLDIELLAFDPPPSVAPADVARVPGDASRSYTGLAWKVLRAGTGTERPGPSSRVTVHYTGWTTNGKMFESSVMRGQPAEFPVDGVIKGWTEGLQQMVVGEKRRFWIPQDLAYKGEPGSPRGTLVFDIELLAVESGRRPRR
jgi:FKBP-type peptidyl-prolyl cis-trans isomerase